MRLRPSRFVAVAALALGAACLAAGAASARPADQVCGQLRIDIAQYHEWLVTARTDAIRRRAEIELEAALWRYEDTGCPEATREATRSDAAPAL